MEKRVRFYKEILTSKEEYWVVAQKTHYREYMKTKRGEDRVMFIAVPSGIKRGQKEDSILLSDVEEIEYKRIEKNIILSNEYPPFQRGMTFYEVYDGFPVKSKVKEFLKKAIQVEEDCLLNYKRIYEGM